MSERDFFTTKECDRCKRAIGTRIMSWFTEETLCLDCRAKEDEIRDKLKKQGKTDHEGCGYIPNV